MKSREIKPSVIDILFIEKLSVSHTVGALLMETDYDTASSPSLLTVHVFNSQYGAAPVLHSCVTRSPSDDTT